MGKWESGKRKVESGKWKVGKCAGRDKPYKEDPETCASEKRILNLSRTGKVKKQKSNKQSQRQSQRQSQSHVHKTF